MARVAQFQKLFDKTADISLEDRIRIKNIFSDTRKYKPNKNKTSNIIEVNLINTPLGIMLGCFVTEGLCLLEFIDKKMLASELMKVVKTQNGKFIFRKTKQFEKLQEEIDQYFSGEKKVFSTPLKMIGTDFQQKAWNILRQIPYGKTINYSEQAKFYGDPNSVRAVASANGRNMISILVPCHRVIGKNGNLVGYAGGIERKQFLLNLEKQSITKNVT